MASLQTMLVVLCAMLVMCLNVAQGQFYFG